MSSSLFSGLFLDDFDTAADDVPIILLSSYGSNSVLVFSDLKFSTTFLLVSLSDSSDSAIGGDEFLAIWLVVDSEPRLNFDDWVLTEPPIEEGVELLSLELWKKLFYCIFLFISNH